MSGVSRIGAVQSPEIVRPIGTATDQLVENVLADVAYALWPENTAPFLADACGCEVRSAERYLGGQRAWSGDAIAAIVAEIMRRHGARNLKVKSR